ncbi:mechanosensitive ion channel family protein [Halocalculus aciditolerans]|uniref:mechanosensitive ion channel family protein n=1 Tax=Halocalculus aciditolerans TaxID=1383812 RepID=UPI00166DD24F|nr:mechanosensitive ion channel family protein [Halocalculus aciditolerans]
MTVPPGVESVLAQYHDLLVQCLVFIVVVAVTYAAGRFLLVPPLVKLVTRRNRGNPTLANATRLYTKVAVAVVGVALATALAGFGSAFQGSALVVAAATLALGVAGQDVIGNLVSGVFLVADEDFNVGDYVEWADQAGTVEQIDFRVTRVRTPNGEIVSVPNSQLTTNALRTPYRGNRYRITDTFGIRYEDDVEEAIRLTKAAAAADDRVLAEPEPTVRVSGFGATSIDLRARYWIRSPEETPVGVVRTAFVERVAADLADAGISINPPSQQELSGTVAVEDRR